MNAKKLKAAFVFRSPVYSSDKDHPVRKGHVVKLIYSLSDSGKMQCAGMIQPWEAGKFPVKIPCRHIHFVGEEPTIAPADKVPDKHTQVIKRAFLEVLPVIVDVPNVTPIHGNIREISYWRNRKGSIKCSAEIIDAGCPHSSVSSRLKYIYTEEEFKKKKGC